MVDRIVINIDATDRTKDRYVALIRAMFRLAMREWEWIDTTPAFKTYSRDTKPRVRWLTHEQVETLLKELPAHQQDLMLFALATGLQQGNIKRLTWEQVDLTRRIVTIEDGETKNGDVLGVPLNDLAISVLQRQMGKQCEHVLPMPGDRSGK